MKKIFSILFSNLTIVLLLMIVPTLEAAPTLTFDYGADDKPVPGVKVTQTESDGTVTIYASNATGQVTLTTTSNTYTLQASLAETGTDPISVQDALYILQHIVELRTLDTEQIKAADINGDGNITIQDALKVLQHNVELITLEPSLSFYDANTGNALSATTFNPGDTPSITVIRQGDANLSFDPSSICKNTLIGFSVCYGEENTTSFYDRDKDYPTWKDTDGDCQNNRHEVLIYEHINDDSLHPLTFTDSNQCSVASGKWYDPYDDIYYYSASDLHIDHVVPLYDAHKSGAWDFPELKKIKFANTLDVPEQLMAVGASSNLSKSSWDPSGWYTNPGWKPNNSSYHCQYLQNWVKIKSIYRLNIDSAERAAIEKAYLESSCSY
jgi:hypothetical protein